YAQWRALARKHDFVLASDECYADLAFGAPPPSALVPGDGPEWRNVLAFHSCSKRSSMTGYRSGFVAGGPTLIAAPARCRPAVGVATPDFIQSMATVAWSDDAHVKDVVATYRRRRDLFLALFGRKGWQHDGGAATFYLWWRVPDGFGDAARLSEKLLERDLLV